MKKEPSEKIVELMKILVEKAGGDPSKGVHINMPMICDNCKDEDKEAFPYHAYDESQNFYQHLCNQCYDELECEKYTCVCFHDDNRPSSHHAEHCPLRDDSWDNPNNTGMIRHQGEK